MGHLIGVVSLVEGHLILPLAVILMNVSDHLIVLTWQVQVQVMMNELQIALAVADIVDMVVVACVGAQHAVRAPVGMLGEIAAAGIQFAVVDRQVVVVVVDSLLGIVGTAVDECLQGLPSLLGPYLLGHPQLAHFEPWHID